MLHLLDGHFAVLGNIHHKAGALQDLDRNLAVELVVLHQQDLLSPEVDGVCLGQLASRLHMERLGQNTAQLGGEEGLLAEGGYAGGASLVFDVRPVVGGQDDDGAVVSNQLADSAHDLDAVHVGNQPVDDEDAEGIALFHGVLGANHRLLAGNRPFRAHPDFGQHGADIEAGVGVVVCHQRVEPLQLRKPFLLDLLLVERKAQVHDELAALARLAFDGDGAAHQVHDALGDGHAKSRARDAAHGGAFLAGELLKDVRLELLAHADAVVLDAELVAGVARGGTVLLGYADADHAARGGELDGVGQDVQQDLVEPQRVGDDVLVFDVHGVDEERQSLRRHIGLNDGAHVMDDVGQMHRLLINLDLAVLDAAHVQHVVDEGKEVLAGGGDLLQVVQHLLAVVDVGRGQRREADDGVHRRADVVAHVEEELPFGAVCRPLMLQGDFQPAVLFLQLGLVLRLLLLVLPLHRLRRACAQYLKD